MLTLILASMRPKQWVKNLPIFAALVFSLNGLNPTLVLRTVIGFFVFSLCASAAYIINDIVDIERDRIHPLKSRRPIASGRLSIKTALGSAAILLVVGLGGAAGLNLHFALWLWVFISLQIWYSLSLKSHPIIDILTIAACFVLRAISGAVLIGVLFSHWLVICGFFLASCLALGKRRFELTTLGVKAVKHRPALVNYRADLLDQMMGIMAASTILSYTLYTVSNDVVQRLGTANLLITVPFVVYGLLRYLSLVRQEGVGGDPTNDFLTDRPLLLTVGVWILLLAIILY